MIPYFTSHGVVDLTDIKPRDIGAAPLADALAKINRFNGRTPQPWSVAAHSVLVSQLVSPAARGWALLHDAHEAFIGDITTPSLDLLCEQSKPVGAAVIRNAVREAKAAIDLRIARHWQVELGREIGVEVARADRIACQAEMFVFFVSDIAVRPEDHDDMERAIGNLRALEGAHDWQRAKELWLQYARDLQASGGLYVPGLAEAGVIDF